MGELCVIREHGFNLGEGGSIESRTLHIDQIVIYMIIHLLPAECTHLFPSRIPPFFLLGSTLLCLCSFRMPLTEITLWWQNSSNYNSVNFIWRNVLWLRFSYFPFGSLYFLFLRHNLVSATNENFMKLLLVIHVKNIDLLIKKSVFTLFCGN